MDVAVFAELSRLHPEARSALIVRRLGPGAYEIDGRCVTLCFQATAIGPAALLVFERGVSGAGTHLQAYLGQAASVALALRGQERSSSVARIPVQQRLTFEASLVIEHDLDGSVDRGRLMRMACEEARLREQAASAALGGAQVAAVVPAVMAPSGAALGGAGSPFAPSPCLAPPALSPRTGGLVGGVAHAKS